MKLTLPRTEPSYLGTAQLWQYPSVSEPGVTHLTTLMENGEIGCSCPGYKFHGKCWHTNNLRELLPYKCGHCTRRFKRTSAVISHLAHRHMGKSPLYTIDT